MANGVLVSQSETTTLFPVIQLDLFGHAKDVTGIRRFGPSEYLDKSIGISVGVLPSRSVYIVLEVAGGPRVRAVLNSPFFNLTFRRSAISNRQKLFARPFRSYLNVAIIGTVTS